VEVNAMPIAQIHYLDRFSKEQVRLLDILEKEMRSERPMSEIAPIITMEKLDYPDAIRLCAIWNEWKDVEKEDRIQILIAAFNRYSPQEVRKVNNTYCVTPWEESKLHLLPRKGKTAKNFEDEEIKEVLGRSREGQVRLHEYDGDWWVVTAPKDPFKDGDAVPFQYREYALSYARGLVRED
jgi:hypothetical protein